MPRRSPAKISSSRWRAPFQASAAMSDAAASPALRLAAEFPSASEADWRERVEAVLKGADFDKKLYARTADGIAIAPLYSLGNAAEIRRPEQTPWTVMQRADHPDAG